MSRFDLLLSPVEHAVSGQSEVPAGSEEEDGLWSSAAASARSVLCGCSSSPALHHGAQDEEYDDEEQTQKVWQQIHILPVYHLHFCIEL